MSNDYLWDRTGEPDAEVRELEEVLGTLRYQPKPLALSADVQPAPRRRYFPALAIAAAIALIVLALGVWLRVHQPVSPSQELVDRKKEFQPPPLPNKPEEKHQMIEQDSQTVVRHRNPATNMIRIVRHVNRSNPAPLHEEMTAAERADAQAAKDQLMLALRVVSAKLNLAQRKTVPATNNIRFQHKVG